MFDSNDDDESDNATSPSRNASPVKRSCWVESTLLTNMIQALPSLNHISFFADASDDSTLALLFAALIPHPSAHPVPPPTQPSSPSAQSSTDNYLPPAPFASRIQSFGWRQRAAPPGGFRNFSQASTFVSTLHLIRHAHRLSFLVLDADIDEMFKEDILTACKELALREPPHGEEAEKVSLMLCGPIRGWDRAFLEDLVGSFRGIKELFIDRPLRKSGVAQETTFEDFVSAKGPHLSIATAHRKTSLVEPLARMPHLQLLQVGSYIFSVPVQTTIAFHLARAMPKLLVLGLLGEEGDTTWWGIWRNATRRHPAPPQYMLDFESDIMLVPLGDGHMRQLEGGTRVGTPVSGMTPVRGMTPAKEVRRFSVA
jgi:hypothetical protein